jgi:Acetyltransferase (GNAT) domain
MKVNVYSGLDEVAQKVPAVSRVGDAADVFRTFPWFKNLAATSLAENRLLRIFTLHPNHTEQSSVSVLPMQYTKSNRTIGPRTLWALGNYYSPIFAPIVSEDTEDTDKSTYALVNAICSDVPKWDVVDLHPLDPSAASFRQINDAFEDAGWIVQPYFCFGNWYLEVGGRTYREYLQTLPAVLRNTLKRKTKKLENENFRMTIISSNEGLNAAIDAYDKVYAASWKRPERYKRFIPGLIRTCADEGWLRLGIAYVDNEPAAAQLWISANRTASIYKLAYDERFTRLSIGSILTSALMEYVIDTDRVNQVDYLVGDEPYKKDWMSHRRERWGIRAFNSHTVRGKIVAVRHIGGQAVKKFMHRILRPLEPSIEYRENQISVNTV